MMRIDIEAGPGALVVARIVENALNELGVATSRLGFGDDDVVHQDIAKQVRVLRNAAAFERIQIRVHESTFQGEDGQQPAA